MTASDPKEDLHGYLRLAREVMVWKLEGLSEYDIRRPLTPTGTNLLGLIKHLSYCELGYFGATFGRPADHLLPALPDDDPHADMWATPQESREDVVGRYQQVCAHADATIEASASDTPGRVPHWSAERSEVTLHLVLTHMLAETQRHAGHADIVRELVDGAAGLRLGNENLPPADAARWEDHRNRLERAAAQAEKG